MTATLMARAGYQASTRSTATPRAIEFQLLSRLTGALVSGYRNRRLDHPAYVSALSRNLEFWTIVGANVANSDNRLPAALRAQLFYLFQYTRERTKKILGGDDTLNVDALVDINRNVMAGLRTTPAHPAGTE